MENLGKESSRASSQCWKVCPRGKRGLPGEQSALSPAPRAHETHFYPSPEAAFHFISWIDAEVIFLSVQKFGLKKYRGLWKSRRELGEELPN